jgi:hypothetical protein
MGGEVVGPMQGDAIGRRGQRDRAYGKGVREGKRLAEPDSDSGCGSSDRRRRARGSDHVGHPLACQVKVDVGMQAAGLLPGRVGRGPLGQGLRPCSRAGLYRKDSIDAAQAPASRVGTVAPGMAKIRRRMSRLSRNVRFPAK